ncbi:MAG: hypothetical protein ABIR79_16950 [Candidatus Binatia bacterium]
MLKHSVIALGLVLGLAEVAAAQATDGPFRVQFVAKLKKKDVSTPNTCVSCRPPL